MAKGLSAIAHPAIQPERAPQSRCAVMPTSGMVSVLMRMLRMRPPAGEAPKSEKAPLSSQIKIGGLSGQTWRNQGSSCRKWSDQ